MRVSIFCLIITITTAPHAIAAERTNPFANPGYVATRTNTNQAGAPPELRLKAVMPAPNNRGLANISGQLLRVGEVYVGYTLVGVTATNVTLQKDGVELVLELRPQLLASGDSS